MRAKHCKKCKVIIPQQNKSGFCRSCYFNEKRKEYYQKKKAKHICQDCKEKVKPKIVYPVRCDECRNKYKNVKNKK